MIQFLATAKAGCRRLIPHQSLHRFAKLAAIAFVVLLTQPPFFPVAKADAATRPNFVFILADDLGWADVGFHGGNAPTPNLDRLAAEGIELRRHYVAPVCSPTRAGLLTGRYWSRFGITTPTNSRGLPEGTLTLARALKTRGYETCLTGKWHLGSKPHEGPNHYGFDHSYGSLAGGVTAWSHRYKKGVFSKTWHRNETLLDETGHVTDLLVHEALTWIEKTDSPFFLYVPFTAVHLPINEPTVWLNRVPDSINSEIGRHYAACVMHLDDAVGQIVSALDQKGVRNETLLVFTSDNGGSTTTNNTQPYPPDDSPPGNLTANNGELRGQKGTVYEGGTRVPTIVSWPGNIKARKEDTPVTIVDWMPTICKLAGYEPKQDNRWDGMDLGPLLLHEMPIGTRPLYIAGPRWKQVSLRLGDWKLVTDSKTDHELFNLLMDPSESRNLAAQYPQRLKELRLELARIQQHDNDAIVRDRPIP